MRHALWPESRAGYFSGAALEQLRWLPKTADWRDRLRALMRGQGDIWPQAVTLANEQLDFIRTNALDDLVRRRHGEAAPDTGTRSVRLAILGSATLAHLHAPIRVAGLRRNIWITTYENDYGQYQQELLDAGSGLHAFKPNAVLFAFDSCAAGAPRVRHSPVRSCSKPCWIRSCRSWAATNTGYPDRAPNSSPT